MLQSDYHNHFHIQINQTNSYQQLGHLSKILLIVLLKYNDYSDLNCTSILILHPVDSINIFD